MVIDGRKIAEEFLEKLKKEIKILQPLQTLQGNKQAQGRLRLAAVLVGNDQEFKKFVELKGRVAEEAGISFKMHQFSKNISNDDLVNEVINISDNSDSVLVELPLPSHINTQAVLDAVPVEKDVDVLSSEGQARFYEVQLRRFFEVEYRILPPAVEALKIILEKYNVDLKGKKAAVFGQGILVGKPISYWLEQQGAEVFRIRSKTESPEKLSRKSDMIVSGVGKPGLINGEMIRDGAIIIDFGYGKNSEGKMAGDVDFDSVVSKASLITPVPGGMGPVLITAVLKNLVKLKRVSPIKLKINE